jgi:TetR/AcrR family transcriptional repressor of nem operon
MRVSKEQMQENRRQIVTTAARLFREHGYNGIGVADLMKEAGFSHGGFYNHFSSKEELVMAASQSAFDELDVEADDSTIDAILRRYISAGHRDDLRQGCPAAALGSDAARQTREIKQVFEGGIEGWLLRIEKALAAQGQFQSADRRQRGINLLAKAVGAVVLARSVSGVSALSDEILEACLAGSLEEAARTEA